MSIERKAKDIVYSSPTRNRRRELTEVEDGIRKLREHTEKLRVKLMGERRREEKGGGSIFLKTWEKGC